MIVNPLQNIYQSLCASLKNKQLMKEIEKMAIKYLMIGIGIFILNFCLTAFQFQIIETFKILNPQKFTDFIIHYFGYLTNGIIGIFILIDSMKFTKNKFSISILGFCLPIFGICFLLIEKYLIHKTINNDK